MPTGKYTDKLFKLLENTRVRRDEKTSHYSMGTPVGSFYISGSKRDRLNRLISRSIQEGTVLHILEAHRSQGPIIFDIDIKYSADTNGRKYTYDHILKTVEVYNSVINKYLNVDDEYKHCFITEKKRPNKVHDGVYKDGFHGEYPNICASNQLQHLIRIEVIKKFIENDYYKDINYTNKYEDIFDAAIIENNGWFVYGCCKPKGNHTY